MRIKTALLSCLAVALAMVAQAQQSNADTALPDYLRDLPHYNLPGIPDSHLMPDSTHQFLLTPPQREHYFLYKPDPKRGWLPGEYKMWLNAYYKNLGSSKKIPSSSYNTSIEGIPSNTCSIASAECRYLSWPVQVR
jgi:hypothetical protein